MPWDKAVLPHRQRRHRDRITPITIYVDADACPVKQEVYRVAERHGVKVYVVSNSPIAVPRDPLIPGATAGLNTLTFKLKGSVLADFRAGRASLEDTRALVDVRQD